jgi:hypothetical protein
MTFHFDTQGRASMKFRNKRFHHEGQDETGRHVFVECTKGEDEGREPMVVKGEPAVSGEAARFGQELCHIRPDGDSHVTIEEISGPSPTPKGGPAMVTSDGYRVGWERVFGSRGVN